MAKQNSILWHGGTTLLGFLVVLQMVSKVGSFSFPETTGLRSPSMLRLATRTPDIDIAPQANEENPTNISLVVPRFYEEEVEEGSAYPSKLHMIYVRSVLSSGEASECLSLARKYAQETGRWNQPDIERHSTYSTCDFAVEDCHSLDSYLHTIGFHERVWNDLNRLYDVPHEDMSYLDFFCVNYQAKDTSSDEESTDTMDSLEAHRDGSILSFTILLNPPSEFEGGGTTFDALRDASTEQTAEVLKANGAVCPTRAGDSTYHSGKLLHGADVVTAGQRTVLVGFVDVADWCIRPKVLAEACRDFGRMDVANFRYQRQQLMSEQGEKNGWYINNYRWIRKTRQQAPSLHLQGFMPAFSSVNRRGDPEYQRKKKLEIEDILLRKILLSENQ